MSARGRQPKRDSINAISNAIGAQVGTPELRDRFAWAVMRELEENAVSGMITENHLQTYRTLATQARKAEAALKTLENAARVIPSSFGWAPVTIAWADTIRRDLSLQNEQFFKYLRSTRRFLKATQKESLRSAKDWAMPGQRNAAQKVIAQDIAYKYYDFFEVIPGFGKASPGPYQRVCCVVSGILADHGKGALVGQIGDSAMKSGIKYVKDIIRRVEAIHRSSTR